MIYQLKISSLNRWNKFRIEKNYLKNYAVIKLKNNDIKWKIFFRSGF